MCFGKLRNCIVNLFAALEVSTGTVRAKTTETKTREHFLLYMDELVKEYGSERELHVILDNYCTHKKNDLWLNENKNVRFHYTSTSALPPPFNLLLMEVPDTLFIFLSSLSNQNQHTSSGMV